MEIMTHVAKFTLSLKMEFANGGLGAVRTMCSSFRAWFSKVNRGGYRLKAKGMACDPVTCCVQYLKEHGRAKSLFGSGSDVLCKPQGFQVFW